MIKCKKKLAMNYKKGEIGDYAIMHQNINDELTKIFHWLRIEFFVANDYIDMLQSRCLKDQLKFPSNDSGPSIHIITFIKLAARM